LLQRIQPGLFDQLDTDTPQESPQFDQAVQYGQPDETQWVRTSSESGL
jgi:hypothetical protein